MGVRKITPFQLQEADDLPKGKVGSNPIPSFTAMKQPNQAISKVKAIKPGPMIGKKVR